MYSRGSVIVVELPEQLTYQGVKSFVPGLQPLLETERPCIVLDCARVKQLDSAGIDVLLHCLEEAMKRNGDLKLAAVPPASAVVLELMRVDRLFEMFATSEEAARSFHSFAPPEREPKQPWYMTGAGSDLKALI